MKFILWALLFAILLHGYRCSTFANFVNRRILNDLYTATNGDNWNDNSNWLIKDSYSEWFGVSVGGDNSVDIIDLELAENNLQGTLPATLGRLTTLTKLSLTQNSLIGTLPDTLSNLVNLEFLNLNANHLNGSIPAGFEALTDLTKFFVRQNNLTGTIPEFLGAFPLIDLRLKNNNFVGTLPPSILDIASLTKLIVQNNFLSGKMSVGVYLPTFLRPDLQIQQAAGIRQQAVGGRLSHWHGSFITLTRTTLWFSL
jgi:hypothetical protein